jgi:hypothetical protein
MFSSASEQLLGKHLKRTTLIWDTEYRLVLSTANLPRDSYLATFAHALRAKSLNYMVLSN